MRVVEQPLHLRFLVGRNVPVLVRMPELAHLLDLDGVLLVELGDLVICRSVRRCPLRARSSRRPKSAWAGRKDTLFGAV